MKSLANKVFLEILEKINRSGEVEDINLNEGIITSFNEFMSLVIKSNDIYSTTFNIPDDKKLIFAEDFPAEVMLKLNNDSADLNVTQQTLNDIRVVTYSVNELPGIISSHNINSDGIRNIKYRFFGIYDDPDHTGYSILRYGKTIDADLVFRVWGHHYQDIRDRSKLLKDIIDTNVWYFLHKGLTSIVWVGSVENEQWDARNIAKFKSEKYKITYTEIKELRQKNLEQIIIQVGLGNES